MLSEQDDEKADNFLQLLQRSKKGKLKIYIGMSPGVGKTYRMLQEGKSMLDNGIDIQIGYIETHGRAETEALLKGLPLIPRRKIFYKGKELEEMDLQTILNINPELVIVDELAHTNVEGSKNDKRWQDVLDLLEAGISVISAVNIQHIESINKQVENIVGISVSERIPDKVLQEAQEVVNIDLTVDELLSRLNSGKIYTKDKIQLAGRNFFQPEKILQLRELALREVAHQVERKIDTEVPKTIKLRSERFMACVSANEITAKNIIRKTARLASFYNCKWFVLYVQTSSESLERIKLNKQRFLINNLKLAKELGAEIIRVKENNVPKAIFETAINQQITTVFLGKPRIHIWQMLFNRSVFDQLLKRMDGTPVDLVIFS